MNVDPWSALWLDRISNSTSIIFPISLRDCFNLYFFKLQVNYLSSCRMTTVSFQPCFGNTLTHALVSLKASCFWSASPRTFLCDTSNSSATEPPRDHLLIVLLTLCMGFPSGVFHLAIGSFLLTWHHFVHNSVHISLWWCFWGQLGSTFCLFDLSLWCDSHFTVAQLCFLLLP